ncbi:MAG: tetratricopeptide repeat protein [Bacteroidales bacterium]|nr:tetratricopeptide repeat protein [Bacteroidales bacterium]
MAKVTKKEEELRQQNMQEAVSKTEEFFKKYGNMMYGCILAVLIAALAILAYNRFILQPKKQQATDQMAQAERWFLSGEYELALSGDDNDPGLLEIIDQYGSKAGEAVYMYAGVAALKTGDYQGAIDYLKKYEGKDPILKARAEACIGDAYAELEDYGNAISCYQKAAKTTDNALAAAYLLKAGIVAEEAGDKAQALSFYKEIKDQWSNAPEAMEIDKYISRIEIAE